jgi:sugar fermentation stimulation protein A
MSQRDTSASFFLPFHAPLVEGRLVRRYHRFLADVDLGGRVVVAHCVNSGRMEGLVERGLRVWLSPAANPARKLAWTWELVEVGGVLVGANTAIPNTLVGAMLRARALPGFRAHRGVVAEAPHGPLSRVDFSVSMPGGAHLVEVKNCHLAYPDGRGYFPDSVSERGTKHLRELAAHARKGGKATVLFTVQRADAVAVRPSDVHDPAFAQAARRAARAGVRFRALRVVPTLEGLRVEGELPVDLEPYELDAPRRFSRALAASSGWERPPAQRPSDP